MTRDGEVTRLLAGLDAGGRDALDRLLPLVYAELHGMAARQLRGERDGHTLNPTALVHEAYLKLAPIERITWQNRAHFMAVAAQAMRRVLVNHATARATHKRGGAFRQVELDDNVALAPGRAADILDLDEALERLRALNERQVRVVECRFFAAMSVEETAAALGVAAITVKRDWAVARAWLNRELAT